MKYLLAITTLVISALALGQCTPIAPTGIGNCSVGTENVLLEATGSTGAYNWYANSTGGSLLGSGNTFVTPTISSTTTYYVAAKDINYALDYRDGNDRVNLGNPTALQITGDLTIEMWLKPTIFNARRNPYAKAYGGEGTITQETNGTLNFYYGTSGTNAPPYQGFNSSVALNLNQWNHIALVRDLSNMKLYWYINGVLTNQTNANYASATAGSRTVLVGDGYTNNYKGMIDELRVWNIARSQTNIQNSMNACLSGNESGLATLFHFNEGVGNTTADASPSGVAGNIQGMNDTQWLESDYLGLDYTESSRVPVVATIMSGTSIDLGADQCLSAPKLLDAGSGYTSYLWNNGSSSQSITATTSGTYYVEVQNSSGCTARDTINLTFIDTPISSDECRFGSGDVTFHVSGSTGLYAWYDAASGGNEVGTGDTYTTPVLNTTTNYYVAALSANNTLDFDGVDDRVELGNPSHLQITGDMTVEMWLKPDNFSSRKNPYAKAYGGEGTITQEPNGTLNYYYGINGGNNQPYQGFNSSQTLIAGQWNHIAIVRDLSNMKLYWYINGVLTNQTNASYSYATAGSNSAFIGKGYVNNYDGQIDEVRIWSAARTALEIQDNMYTCTDLNSSTLNAYYDFDDSPGTAIIADKSSYNHDGVLVNMDLIGDRVISSNLISCNCESDRVLVVASILSGTSVNLGPDKILGCDDITHTLDANNGYANYLWSTGATSQSITVNTAGVYWVRADDGSSCYSTDTIVVTQSSGAQNAIDYNGSSHYVNLGNPDQLKITGDMTIEMWIKPESFNARRNPFAKAYGGEGTITQEPSGYLNYYYGISGTNNSPYQGFGSGAALNLNQWNHIAIVRDLTNMKLYWYINGVLTNQTNANYSVATAGANSAFIGQGYVNRYDGQIDEIRIWNSARTMAQVRANMCQKVSSIEPSLVAYYRCDANAGNILIDATNNHLDGTIVNSPARVISGAAIGDYSDYLYVSTWAGKSMTHVACSGENLTVSNMSGNPKGVHIYSVGSKPNSTTNIIGLGANNRYFGVFKVNDNAASYKATYDYANNPYVSSATEADLAIFTRPNNAVTSWIEPSYTLDVAAKTIETTATGTEFILGTHRFLLPITLMDFTAQLNDKDEVALFWMTASELNNDYFTVERTVDGEFWETVMVIQGAGNSTEIIEYNEADDSPLSGISYYRLKQTDYDGKFSYSDIKMVERKIDYNTTEVVLWPNPNKDSWFNIELSGFEKNREVTIRIFNLMGIEVHTEILNTDALGHVKERITLPILTNGSYIIQAYDGLRSNTQRFIKL